MDEVMIELTLVNGTTSGIRIAERLPSAIKTVIFPKTLLKDACGLSEAKQLGVYLLIGNADESGRREAYVGQGLICDRLRDHNNKNKFTFWEQTLFFVAHKSEALDEVCTRYMESKLIRLANPKLCRLANGQKPLRKLSKAQQNAMEELITDARLFFGVFGCDLFESGLTIASKANVTGSEKSVLPEFFLSWRGFNAAGVIDPRTGKFVVRSGSQVTTPTAKGLSPACGTARSQLMANGILSKHKHTFTQDWAFDSVSAAASVVCGSKQNGWIRWKTKEGETLAKWQKRQLPHEDNSGSEFH